MKRRGILFGFVTGILLGFVAGFLWQNVIDSSVGSMGLCFALARYNGDGSLDTDFDTNGNVTTDFYGYCGSYEVAIQNDGKIVVAGDSLGQFVLTRYDGDGRLDTGFGMDGKVATQFPSFSENGGGVVLMQSDGKIVLAGVRGSRFALRRDNRNAQFPSSSYSGAGVVGIQSDGKIVVAGLGHGAVALVGYNCNGSLDITFDSNDLVTTDFDTGGAWAGAIAIQSDGKIVAAGGIFDGGFPPDGDFALARYHRDGTLDTTFDSDGMVTIDFGAQGYATGLALQNDGKIVATGDSGRGFVLARYNRDGTPDTTFDSDGMVAIDFDTTAHWTSAVAIQSDGKIVVAGSNYGDFALARYNYDGTLDTSFDSDGVVTTDFGRYESASVVVIQCDGRIVVGGISRKFVYTPDGRFVLARYNLDGKLDIGFGTDGKVITGFGQ